jgi:hypothetical protein
MSRNRKNHPIVDPRKSFLDSSTLDEDIEAAILFGAAMSGTLNETQAALDNSRETARLTLQVAQQRRDTARDTGESLTLKEERKQKERVRRQKRLRHKEES